MENRTLRKSLSERKEFVHTLELVPGRGSRGKNIDEVLKIALVRVPEPITWDEAAEAEALEAKDSDKGGARITAH